MGIVPEMRSPGKPPGEGLFVGDSIQCRNIDRPAGEESIIWTLWLAIYVLLHKWKSVAIFLSTSELDNAYLSPI